MNASSMENEEMKIHIESRKKALQELRQIYTEHSYSPTSNLGCIRIINKRQTFNTIKNEKNLYNTLYVRIRYFYIV